MLTISKFTKRLLACGLLVIYLLNPVKLVFPYLNYAINFEYIASELCVNKEKIELNCKGSCHLTKELKKASEDESKSTRTLFTQTPFEEAQLQQAYIFKPGELEISRNKYPYIKERLLQSFSDKIVPPPRG